MAPINTNLPSIETLRKFFTYDPDTGVVCRIDGRVDFIGPLSPTATKVEFDGCWLLIGRLSFALYYGRWPAELLDHIDGDTLNNKLTNLREATYRQNQFNKVGFGQYSKGVVFKNDANRSKPWSARIRINGKKVAIGSYATEAEAAEAYRKKAEEVQGEFALHNSLVPR